MAFENLQNLLQFNLRALLPFLLIALVGIGNILFAVTSILPRWSAYEAMTTQIDENQAALDARAAEGDDPEMIDVLQKQIDNARTNLDAASTVFLTEPQANQMLNQLFGYAADSGVEITNLQAQQADQSAPD
ncbi:MAG: hypothetical protein K8J31_02480, partial [Anaerolineae bacterium]|nr:hypothetical protein [Anaerolineae bacterium]